MPVSKAYILHDSISVIFTRQNHHDGEQIPGCQALGDRKGVTTKHSRRELFGGLELFCILITVVVTQMYTCVRLIVLYTDPQKSILPYDNFKNICTSRIDDLFRSGWGNSATMNDQLVLLTK